MIKKRRIVTIVSIAIISFLIGTTFNVVTTALESGGNPWIKVWTAISELQTQVQSLNETIEILKAQIPKKTAIITSYKSIWENIASAEWIDLISISNVTVLEGQNVLAIASLYASGKQEPADFYVRFRIEETFSEVFRQNWFYDHTDELIEIHHAWVNLTEGKCSFALQIRTAGVVGVYSVRLTLMIF